MAVRPIFISTGDVLEPFIKEDIEFTWVKGMSYSQKCKRRDNKEVIGVIFLLSFHLL